MGTFPDIASGEPISVSATLYVTYRTCPQQALGRLQGIYPPDTVVSFKGSLAHRLFARHLTSGPIPDDQMLQACREEIGAREGHLNEKLASLALNRPSKLAPVLAEVGDLYERFRRFPTEGFRQAEVPVEVAVPGDVMLRGRVDAVFDDADGVAIVDWKTGSWLANSEVQLGFYVLAWWLMFDEMPSRAEAVSVSTGERAGVDPNVEQAEATAREVAAMVEDLRDALAVDGELERRAGPHCRWCPLLPDCSEGTTAVGLLDGS
ncbi:MAG: PD-(D/E)XK nuclease family protein [Actinomycetota bacterium]